MTWCAFAVHVECLRGDGGAAEQDNANKEVPSRRWGYPKVAEQDNANV